MNSSSIFRRLYHKPITYCYKVKEAAERDSIFSPIPTFRLIDEGGKWVGEEYEESLLPKIILNGEHEAIRMLKYMIKISVVDKILNESQRQGRIPFYLTSTGEEAVGIGSAAALNKEDFIYAQYREVGVLLWRGFTVEEVINQCFGNCKDPGKGRHMPVHYTSSKLNFFTISSPLATQIPQAAGAAYSLKMDGKSAVVMCYFGEGAASEGDFHAGLNIAATTESPVIYFCRNNGYAISTSLKEQYKGDGIAARGIGYGIPTYRVDGNDILAVRQVTSIARDRAIKEKTPILIEAITYRVGHHSTSDDSTAYRSKEEIERNHKENNPIIRFSNYLKTKGWWTEKQENKFSEDTRKQILIELEKAEKLPKAPIEEMFNDVYDELPWNLQQQKKELFDLIKKYPEEFPDLKNFSKGQE